MAFAVGTRVKPIIWRWGLATTRGTRPPQEPDRRDAFLRGIDPGGDCWSAHVSIATVRRDWAFARALLFSELKKTDK